MKYALSFFIFSIFSISIVHASERTIVKFSDSDSILTVAQFMSDAAEDIPVSARLSDKKVNIKDFSKCTTVTAALVLKDVEATMKKILRYYPDEELPIAEALSDVENFLDNQTYKKCELRKIATESVTRTSYYVNETDSIHLRLDNIALVTE